MAVAGDVAGILAGMLPELPVGSFQSWGRLIRGGNFPGFGRLLARNMMCWRLCRYCRNVAGDGVWRDDKGLGWIMMNPFSTCMDCLSRRGVLNLELHSSSCFLNQVEDMFVLCIIGQKFEFVKGVSDGVLALWFPGSSAGLLTLMGYSQLSMFARTCMRV